MIVIIGIVGAIVSSATSVLPLNWLFFGVLFFLLLIDPTVKYFYSYLFRCQVCTDFP